MRAVICGAGLAGLTLASQLGNAGWDVLVLERGAGPSAGSHLVDLSDAALFVAERMGILTTLREIGERVSRVRWVDENGATIADVEIPVDVRARRGALKVLRGDIERALIQSLPSNVELRFGFDVSDIRPQQGRVDLKLFPSGQLTADLLIGADGIHSHIRDLVFGYGGSSSRPLGYDTAAFVLEDAALRQRLDGRFTVLSVPGRHVALCPMRSGRIAACMVHRNSAPNPPQDPAAHLATTYGDLGWCVPSVLAHARQATELRYEQAAQIKLPAWHRGRVGLLGDACHAYSLLPGQGSSVAMTAAFWLGAELLRTRSVDAALARYQSRLMAEVAGRRQSTRKAARWLVPATRTDLMMRNSLLRLASMPGVDRLLRPVVTGMT